MTLAPKGAIGVERPTVRHYFEYVGISVAGWIVRRLPYRWLEPISRGLGSLVYFLDRRGRAVALENLEAAFGDTRSAGDKRRIARASYGTFARTMLELFWSPNLTPQVQGELFHISGLTPGHPPSPGIFVTTHSSNFEWLGICLAAQLGPAVVVAQKLKNPLLSGVFNALRAVTGHRIIPQERAVARMLKHLKSGGYFCAVIDLNLDPREASVIIDEFSGLKTCVTQIHAALALHTGAKIVPCECRPRPDGTYDMVFHPPLEFAEGTSPAWIAQQCWDVLEPGIRARPECWLWSYKHWRQKPNASGTERYPAYSNTATRFDLAILRSQSPKASN